MTEVNGFYHIHFLSGEMGGVWKSFFERLIFWARGTPEASTVRSSVGLTDREPCSVKEHKLRGSGQGTGKEKDLRSWVETTKGKLLHILFLKCRSCVFCQ